MTEDGDPRLEAGPLFEVGSDLVGDAAEALKPESVLWHLHRLWWLDPFGDHDDRVFAAPPVPGSQYLSYLVEVVGDLRDEDGVGAPRQAGVRGDPALGSPHHLDEDHPVVGFGGRGQAVDGVGGDLHRGIETEREVGGGDVIVDRLGYADDRDPVFDEAQRRTQRAVAADHDHGVETIGFEGLADPLSAIAVNVRVLAGGAENRPTLGEDAPHVVAAERAGVAVHEPLPAVENPHHFVPAPLHSPGHHPPDHGVQTGAVASGGEDSDDAHEAS
jgi:hypothetical protein